jgi:hypothetical protein
MKSKQMEKELFTFWKRTCKKYNMANISVTIHSDTIGNFTVEFKAYSPTAAKVPVPVPVVQVKSQIDYEAVQHMVNIGFAEPDTIVWVFWNGDFGYALARIKCRTKRGKLYEVVFFDTPEDEVYRLPYSKCYVLHPETKQPSYI